jgi:hypothetical protein
LQSSTIEPCQQRKQEEAKIQSGYDSGDEGLGSLGKVQTRKLTARISYKQVTKTGGIVTNIPELSLIPSDWRLSTATKGNTQGDHVIAYVLLLNSLSHCQGEHIKKLPTIICEMACRVLPDDKASFLNKKQRIETTLEKHRAMRKEAVASLKNECKKPEKFIEKIEESLKRTEIEYIARHVEKVVDLFIETVNSLEGESFSQKRKEGIKINFILQKIASFVQESPCLKADKFNKFRETLFNTIMKEAKQPTNNKSGSITDKMLEQITRKAIKNNGDSPVPDSLLKLNSKPNSSKIAQAKLLAFLKRLTPLKKYHEGSEVKWSRKKVVSLSRTEDASTRQELLKAIGEYCARLFSVHDKTMAQDKKIF